MCVKLDAVAVAHMVCQPQQASAGLYGLIESMRQDLWNAAVCLQQARRTLRSLEATQRQKEMQMLGILARWTIC